MEVSSAMGNLKGLSQNWSDFIKGSDYIAVVMINSLYILVLMMEIPAFFKVVIALGSMCINLIISHHLIEVSHSKDLRIYELITAMQDKQLDDSKIRVKDLIR
jgi:hypothetical protein